MFPKPSVIFIILAMFIFPVQTHILGSESFEITQSPQNLMFKLEGYIDAAHARIYPYNYPVMQPEKSLKIINKGQNPVENIRLVINNSKNWFDFDSWFEEITEDTDTELEKALAVFWFFSYHCVHNCSIAPKLDPVLFINYSAYGCCPHMSAVMRFVLSAKEMPFLNSSAIGHSVNEYLIDGKMRHLDTDIKVIYLDRDNTEPTGIEAARLDPYLIKRVPHYFSYDPDLSFDPSVTHWPSTQKMASLYNKSYDAKEPVLEKISYLETINITLRKGESLEYLYDIATRVKYFEEKASYYKETFKRVFMNGVWETNLNFSDPAGYPFVDLQNLKAPNDISDRGLKFINPAAPARISLSLEPAYPILGMDVMIKAQGVKTIALNLGSADNPKVQKTVPLNAGTWNNLDSYCMDFYPSQNYRLSFTLNPDPQMENVVGKIVIKTYIQMARVAAPELKVGDNEIVYSDSNPDREIEIQLECEPITMARPPQPPEQCFYPETGSTIHDSQIVFKWEPALDETGSDIEYYHFQLSDRSDMRFPLSPNFERPLNLTLSRGNPYYILPFPGLLHTDKTYFWRVRAVNEESLVSDWSPVWEFTPQFPDYPQNLRYEIEGDDIYLTWDAGSMGTHPQYFRIYGSNVYGFVPYDHPYVLEGFAKADKPSKNWSDYSVTDWKAYPTNFMAGVKKDKFLFFNKGENKIKVVSQKSKYPNMNRLYYRVVAVDKWGSQSAPSQFITLPEGFIYSPSEVKWDKSDSFTYKIRYLKYMGQVTSKDMYFSGLWDQPTYTYSAQNLPEGLIVNKENGYITGTLDSDDGKDGFAFTIQVMKNNTPLTEKTISVVIDTM